jgi:SAM-dependent methyltransferase
VVFDAEAESARVETQPWGNAETALALNDFKQRMFDRALAAVRARRPAPGRLLDIGCSFGGFLWSARAAGYDVYGTDIGAPAVAFVQSQGVPAAVAASVTELPDAYAAFDIISVLDVNCYWPDQPGELRGIRSRLRPGGVLVMRVVDKSWMMTLGLRLRRLWPRGSARLRSTAVNDHRFSMPLRSFLRELDRAGFVRVSVRVHDGLHSDQTRWPARLMFRVGDLLWRLARRNIAPGALVIAERPA